jgi:hypothetical protein
VKVRLTNTAMMPIPGQYRCRKIDEREFVAHLCAYWQKGLVTSYVGYPANQKHIEKISGIEVPINRAPTELDPGDILLCMRMAYEDTEEARKHPSDDKTMWQYRDGPRNWQYFFVAFDGAPE